MLKTTQDIKQATIDKAWLRTQFAEMDARTGFVPDPSVTALEARKRMLADGIRPEDNVLSSEIIRQRYEGE